MTKNEDFRYLCVDLPGDIARRKAAGDLSGALRLVEARLAGTANRSWPPACGASGCGSSVSPGLPLSPRPGAGVAAPGVEGHHRRAVRRPGGRRPGRLAVHQWGDAPPRGLCGLPAHLSQGGGGPRARGRGQHPAKPDPGADGGGGESYCRHHPAWAAIRSKQAPAGREVQAWLPIPWSAPSRADRISGDDPGGVCALGDAPQRTVWWKSRSGGTSP
ncbi:MAG: hypothetical protein ACLSAF_07410 [Intestinimonas sp.]